MSKKIILTLVTSIMVLTLAGCDLIAPTNSTTNDNSEATGNERTTGGYKQLLPVISGRAVKLELDANADKTTQQLNVKDVMIVKLESNPSTGFSWLAKTSDPNIIQQLGESQYAEPTASTNEPVVGSPGTQTLYFEAAATGTATITLEYKRSWEADVSPEKTITIEIIVKQD